MILDIAKRTGRNFPIKRRYSEMGLLNELRSKTGNAQRSMGQVLTLLEKQQCYHRIELYREMPNISPGLNEVRKHNWKDLYLGGFIFGRSLGVTGDLYMPKIYHSVSNQRD